MADAIDIITRKVVEQISTAVEQRVAGAVAELQDEAQRRITEAVAALPQIAIPTAEPPQLATPTDAPDDVKADARDRATRTLLQGGVATVLVAVFSTLATVVGNGALDPTSWESWKLVGGTVLGAAIMAGASFVQRLVQPPKGQ